MTNNDLQNITQKTKDRATRTPHDLRCSGRVGSSCSTCGITLLTNPMISYEWRKNRIVITTNGNISRGHLWHRYG